MEWQCCFQSPREVAAEGGSISIHVANPGGTQQIGKLKSCLFVALSVGLCHMVMRFSASYVHPSHHNTAVGFVAPGTSAELTQTIQGYILSDHVSYCWLQTKTLYISRNVELNRAQGSRVLFCSFWRFNFCFQRLKKQKAEHEHLPGSGILLREGQTAQFPDPWELVVWCRFSGGCTANFG